MFSSDYDYVTNRIYACGRSGNKNIVMYAFNGDGSQIVGSHKTYNTTGSYRGIANTEFDSIIVPYLFA